MAYDMNNPPAFPRPASHDANHLTGETGVVVDPQVGMTLRDYFAAHAMAGLVAAGRVASEIIAFDAYEIADAMAERRSMKQP